MYPRRNFILLEKVMKGVLEAMMKKILLGTKMKKHI
jgi:hypothetical protein